MSHTDCSIHNDGDCGSHSPSEEGTPHVPEASAAGSGTPHVPEASATGSGTPNVPVASATGSGIPNVPESPFIVMFQKLRLLLLALHNVPEASATGTGTDTDSDDSGSDDSGSDSDTDSGSDTDSEETELRELFPEDYDNDLDLWEKLPDDNPTKKRLMSVKLTCEHSPLIGPWSWGPVCGKSLTPFLAWMTDQHASFVDGLGYRCYKHLCDCQKSKEPEFCGACYKECCGKCAKGCDCLD